MRQTSQIEQSTQVQFKAIIKINGVNPYVDVSKKIAGILKPNCRKPIPVLVRINGKPDKPWHINLVPKGDGSFYPYLHNMPRVASTTKVGDRVRAELCLDHRYRGGPTHPMPKWLREALAQNPQAAKAWKALPARRKKEIIRYLVLLKSTTAQMRNLDKTIKALSGAQIRFLGRDWVEGR